MLTIIYFLVIIAITAIIATAGMFLVDAFLYVLNRLFKLNAEINMPSKLGLSYACLIFFVSLWILPFYYGFHGLNLTIAILGKVILLLSLAEVYLLVRKSKPLRFLRALKTNLGVTICIAFFLFFILYLYSVQSVDTQVDFLVFDYRAIGWSLYDDTLSNPTLRTFYSSIDPAVWLYPVVNNILNIKDSFFALPILGLISFATLTYAFSKQTFGEKTALCSFILFFASPLLLVYSKYCLYRDLEVYYLIFSCFYGIFRLSTAKEKAGRYLWSFLSGIAAASALFVEIKGFAVILFLAPSLMAYFSERRTAKLLWPFLSGAGMFSWVWLFHLWDVGELKARYLDVPLLLTGIYIAGLSAVYYVRYKKSERLVSWRNSVSAVKLYGGFFLALIPSLFYQFSAGRLSRLVGAVLYQYFGFSLLPSLDKLFGTNVEEFLGMSDASSPLSGMYYQYVDNLGNIPNLFAGIYTFPLLMPLCIIGTFVLIYFFLIGREDNSGALLTYFWVATFSWIFFMQADVSAGNLRFLLFSIPFLSIASSRALSFLLNRKIVPYVALLVAAVYLHVLMKPDFNLLSFWPTPYVIYEQINQWVGLEVLAFGLITLLLIGVVWKPDISVSRRNKFHIYIKLVKPKFTTNKPSGWLSKLQFAVIFILIITPAFTGSISSTIFMNVYNVKTLEFPGWNYGLKEPFRYISEHRAEFDGKFLTLYANGIEYYTGVVSVEFHRYEFAWDFWSYVNDTEKMREYLDRNNIKYALFPLPSNELRGEEAVRVFRYTALGKILLNSTIVKYWPATSYEGGWILFDISSEATREPLAGCVLYLDFDEGEGNAAYDKSPYKNNGTIYGASWADGKFGKALEFDGVDDYIEARYSSILDITNELTLEMWIKPSMKYTAGVNCAFLTREWHPYDLQYENGRLQFYVLIGGIWTSAFYQIDLQVDEWYYIVGVFDGRYARLYLNGEQVAIKDWGEGATIETTTNNLCIGAGRPTSYFFNGAIDEVHIYNRVLSPIEVLLSYSS